MSHRASRVVVLRSSRFAAQAVAAARDRWPEAVVEVVHQPGTEPELIAAGCDRRHLILFDEAPRYRIRAFQRSRARARLRDSRPDEVVVQWSSSRGPLEWRLNLIALRLNPRRFWVLRPGSPLVAVTPAGWLAQAGRRALTPLAPVRRALVATTIVGVVLVLWLAALAAFGLRARGGGEAQSSRAS